MVSFIRKAINAAKLGKPDVIYSNPELYKEIYIGDEEEISYISNGYEHNSAISVEECKEDTR